MKPRRRLAGARRAGGETGRDRRCADSVSGRRGQILQRLIIVAQNLTGGRSTESVLQLAPIKNAAFTMAARLSRFHNGLVGLRSAFTMAEILLSLTIIGVVAAITLPSLTGNINERTWNTQRKALYARMSQAFPLLGSVNGYADAETFITGALSKVLKINNICSGDKLADCGIPEKFITLAGNNFSYSLPFKISELNAKMTSMSHSDASLGLDILYSDTDTEAAAFETANGESILLFYFPKCQSDMGETTLHLVQPKICVNMIYDLNSSKGPNTVGKDVGVMTVLYSTDSMIVSPQPWYRNASTSHTNWYDALAYCKNLDEDYRLPNRDEAAAIFVNNSLFEFGSSWSLWTASSIDSNRVWEQSLGTGNRRVDNKNDVNAIVRCVKR